MTEARAHGVDDQAGPVRRAGDPRALPPQQGAHTGDQFIALEGLGQVVVGAGLQAIDAVVEGIPCREQQAGHQHLPGAQALQPGQCVALGQPAVEHQRRVPHLRQAGLGLADPPHGVGRDARALKLEHHEFAHGGVVLDEQDAVHGRQRIAARWPIATVRGNFSSGRTGSRAPAAECHWH